MPTKFMFGSQAHPVRFSYMHIWEPSKMKKEDDSKLRYSVVIMLDKLSPQCKAMAEAIKAEKEAGKTEVWKGKIPGGLKAAYRDGDDEDIFPDKPEYRGYWIITAKAVNKPGIVNKQLQPIIDRDEIGSGDWGIVDGAFNAYTFDEGVSNGVNVFLNNICVVKRGERFGGREDAETAFKDVIQFEKPEGYNPLDDEDDLTAKPKSKKRNLLD